MRCYSSYKETDLPHVNRLPDEWRVMALKHLAEINREALSGGTDPDYHLRYIDIGNVSSDGRVQPPEAYRFADAPSRARRVVQRDDIIVSTVRTYLKAVAFIDFDDEDLIASTGFAVLTPRSGVIPKFVYYLMTSQLVVDEVSARSVGVSYPAITSTDLGDIEVWLPSTVAEQRAIAAFLDRKTEHIDTLIRKFTGGLIIRTDETVDAKKGLVALLMDLRTSLIAEVVTGKIDVRDWERKEEALEAVEAEDEQPINPLIKSN